MENKLNKLKELDNFIEKIEGVYSACSQVCFDENNCCSVISTITLCNTVLELVVVVDYLGRADIEIKSGSFGSFYLCGYAKYLINIDKNMDNIINKALDVIEA